MGRARAQSDSRRRHLRFRLVGCALRFQLLVRRIDRAGRYRCSADSARAARDATETGHVTWAGTVVRGVVTWIFLVGIVGLPYWIVLIPLHDLLLGNELRRQLANSPALWFTFGPLAASHFWKAFRGLRHDARQVAKAAGALVHLSPDPACDGDVHHGRARACLHSGAANGAAPELS